MDQKDERLPQLLRVTKALVEQLETAMDGMTHPTLGPFIRGVTDIEINRDGSLTLEDARRAIAAFEQPL